MIANKSEHSCACCVEQNNLLTPCKEAKKRNLLQIGFFPVSIMLLVLLFILSLKFGTYVLSFSDIWNIVFDKTHDSYFALVEYRFPRAVLAVLIGAALAGSGVLVQTIVRNPLASPDILGINNAAGLIAVSTMIFVPGIAFYWLPIAAFVGGILSFLLLWIICGFQFRPIRMAVIGIALSALFVALTHYIMLSNPVNVNTALIWLTGSLWGRSWSYLIVVLPWLLVLLPIPFFFARDLDALALGEIKSQTLGVSLNKLQIIVLFLSTALATTAVAVCGPIAFLGLASPHLARRLVGGKHAKLFPAALLLGAILLLFADITGRIISPPLELPAGVITSILGGPYFFYLLIKHKTNASR